MSPYVVYKSQHLWNTWTEGGPVGTRYNRNNQVGLKLKRQPRKKVLLGDNLPSHINTSVIKSCNENDIAFLCLPPDSIL